MAWRCYSGAHLDQREDEAGLARARRSGKVLGRTPYAVDMAAFRAKQKSASEPAKNPSRLGRQPDPAGGAGQGELTRLQIHAASSIDYLPSGTAPEWH